MPVWFVRMVAELYYVNRISQLNGASASISLGDYAVSNFSSRCL